MVVSLSWGSALDFTMACITPDGGCDSMMPKEGNMAMGVMRCKGHVIGGSRGGT